MDFAAARSEGEPLDALDRGGLLFDYQTYTGLVPQMLACLAIDGRLGITAIAPTPRQAQSLFDHVVAETRIAAAATGC
jgi:hypothetical protein